MPGKVVSIHQARRRALALRKAKAVKSKRQKGLLQWVRNVWEGQYSARAVFVAGMLAGGLLGALIVWSYTAGV